MRVEYAALEKARRADEDARVECITGKAKTGIAFEKPVEIEVDACKRGVTWIVDGRTRDHKIVRELLQVAQHRAAHHGVGIDNKKAFAFGLKEQFNLGKTQPAPLVRE